MDTYIMNNTLQNGFRLLEHLSLTAQEHSVTELTEVFALPKSHICRLLKTLIFKARLQTSLTHYCHAQ